MSENKRTPLYEEHVKLNAKIIDFHGWDMPLQYSKIMEEHMAVRKHVGIFDVSHMGDIVVEGKDAPDFLDHMFPTKVSSLENNNAVYTAFLNDQGNIIDDTIVYRISETRFFFVPNASMIDIIHSWVLKNAGGYSIKIDNYSDDIACIALQGPYSKSVIDDLGMQDPGPFKFNELSSRKINFSANKLTEHETAIISGTGYTGEHGVEILCNSKNAVPVWQALVNSINRYSGAPCGLGCRDTLRMEKGMLLSGTDFHENRNPYECSISFIVTNDGDFIGKNAIAIKKNEVFRGFILDSKIIPRAGNAINYNGKTIGSVTSGTLSPILEKSIALGFINKDFSKSGNGVKIEIRNRELEARVSKPKMVP